MYTLGIANNDLWRLRRTSPAYPAAYYNLTGGQDSSQVEGFEPIPLPLCCLVKGHQHCQVCLVIYDHWKWNYSCESCYHTKFSKWQSLVAGIDIKSLAIYRLAKDINVKPDV